MRGKSPESRAASITLDVGNFRASYRYTRARKVHEGKHRIVQRIVLDLYRLLARRGLISVTVVECKKKRAEVGRKSTATESSSKGEQPRDKRRQQRGGVRRLINYTRPPARCSEKSAVERMK